MSMMSINPNKKINCFNRAGGDKSLNGGHSVCWFNVFYRFLGSI